MVRFHLKRSSYINTAVVSLVKNNKWCSRPLSSVEWNRSTLKSQSSCPGVYNMFISYRGVLINKFHGFSWGFHSDASLLLLYSHSITLLTFALLCLVVLRRDFSTTSSVTKITVKLTTLKQNKTKTKQNIYFLLKFLSYQMHWSASTLKYFVRKSGDGRRPVVLLLNVKGSLCVVQLWSDMGPTFNQLHF